MLKSIRFVALASAAFIAMAPLRLMADPVISVKPADYIPSSPPYPGSTMFIIPVEIADAVDLLSWQFSLTFDPADVQINASCDSSGSDPFCDPIFGPVTEGPFFASVASFPPLFDPGFIFNAQGLLDTVAGAWQDPPPGPSGDGILAYVEFITTEGGSGVSPITVIGGSTTSSAAPEPATLGLVAGALMLFTVVRLRRTARFAGLASKECLRSHVMPHAVTRAFAFAATALALASPAQADSVGPYYATPSWDQTLPSSTRFIVLANMNGEAVLDRETALVWQRSPLGSELHNPWRQANSGCLNARTGNRAGWRLPTVNELASLFDVSSTSNPPLPAGHPFTNLFLFGNDTVFWTSTPSLEGSHRLIGYAGETGETVVILDDFADDASDANAWCVRGGLFSGSQ